MNIVKARVIIGGGREFNDYEYLTKCLASLDIDCTAVLSGTARGADSLGEMWAKDNDVMTVQFPADWDIHGKSAGYRRNVEMSKYAQAVVVFWDGKSKGTKHMIDIAKKANIPTTIFNY